MLTCLFPDWQFDIDTRVLWCAECGWCITFEALERWGEMWKT